MTTTNKPVTSYLPNDVHLALIEYCTSKGLTRKDKDGNSSPSLGTAIVEILKDYFQIISLEQSDLNQKLEDCFGSRIHDLVHDLVLRCLKLNKDLEFYTNEQVHEKVNDLVHNPQEFNGITQDSRVQDKVQDSVLQIFNPLLLSEGKVPKEVQGKVQDSQIQFNDATRDNQVQDKVQDSVLQSLNPLLSLQNSSLEEILLDTKSLAIRLNVNSSDISFRKNNKKVAKSDFLKWLHEKDPDNLEWDFRPKQYGKGVHYFPISKSMTNDIRQKLLNFMKTN